MNTRFLSVMGLIAVSGVTLSGCDWVDSTGSQSVPVSATDVFLGDTPVGDAIIIDESTSARITTTRESSPGREQVFLWSDEPLEQGNLEVCAEQDGFNPEFAASTLLEACTVAADCQLDFDRSVEEAGSNIQQFTLDVPMLQASVGLLYELSVEDADGISNVTEYSFCLIAINEAPVANDDTFVVTEGAVLNVTPQTINLLSNDVDDVDVSNTEFVISPEAVVEPEFASFFELSNDGSFTYRSNLANLSEDRTDTFQYELSDGVFASTGTATIRVVATNQEPQQLSAIPVIEATENLALTEDLSELFLDPEGGTLDFALATNTPLALGSGLELSSAGVLSGTPTAADVGSYSLTMIVSDGGRQISTEIVLEIAAAPVVLLNSAPVFVTGTVFSQTVRIGTSIQPVEAIFTDADGDFLRYRIAGSGILPFGVSLNAATGTLSGTPQVTGAYSGLQILAIDSSNATGLSTPFTLNVLSSR